MCVCAWLARIEQTLIQTVIIIYICDKNKTILPSLLVYTIFTYGTRTKAVTFAVVMSTSERENFMFDRKLLRIVHMLMIIITVANIFNSIRRHC